MPQEARRAKDFRTTFRTSAGTAIPIRPLVWQHCPRNGHRWLGRQLYRDDTARGVEKFELLVERSPASDPNDPPDVRSSLALRTRDGQVFRVRAHQDDIEPEVQRARQWQSQGMPGEYVFVARTQGGLAPVVAVGSLIGGVVGLGVQRARGRRPQRT